MEGSTSSLSLADRVLKVTFGETLATREEFVGDLDGIFMLELFRGAVSDGFKKLCYSRCDPIFATRGTMHSIQRDMIMLENQVPFFILDCLLALQLGSSSKLLAHLAIQFFDPLMPTDEPLNNKSNRTKLEFVKPGAFSSFSGRGTGAAVGWSPKRSLVTSDRLRHVESMAQLPSDAGHLQHSSLRWPLIAASRSSLVTPKSMTAPAAASLNGFLHDSLDLPRTSRLCSRPSPDLSIPPSIIGRLHVVGLDFSALRHALLQTSQASYTEYKDK